MFTTLNKQQTISFILGPAGKLEIMLTTPTAVERNAWGIICHPHPLYGGTMYNKVVTTLAKVFQNLGVTTVRFNFRGVGQSEGRFDQGVGELEDLLAVISWLLEQNPNRDLWLAGFSFGAYIAAKAATKIPVKHLVTVAPPVKDCRMETLPPITCPWILAQGELDELFSADEVIKWAESRTPKPIILRFPQTGHFFHGHLALLRTRLEEILSQQ